MGSSKNKHWLGPGVFSFKGKEYSVGQKMPSGVSVKKMNALIRAGRVGSYITPSCDSSDQIIADLRGEVGKLQALVAEKVKAIEGLQGAVEKVDELSILLEEKSAQIKRLETAGKKEAAGKFRGKK